MIKSIFFCDNGSIESDFLEWKQEAIPHICTHFGIDAKMFSRRKSATPQSFTWRVKIVDDPSVYQGKIFTDVIASSSQPKVRN